MGKKGKEENAIVLADDKRFIPRVTKGVLLRYRPRARS